MKPRVYFAGKIAKNDWRTDLFGYRCGSFYGDDLKNLSNPNHCLDEGDFFYQGPFFISCDHGCSHGPNQHGVINSCCQEDEAFQLNEHWNGHNFAGRKKVFDISRERLRRTDLVFAYINSLDCFGTLVEIGWAYQLGKPIAICFDLPELKDMWFVKECATYLYQGNCRDAWNEFHRAVILNNKGAAAKPGKTIFRVWHSKGEVCANCDCGERMDRYRHPDDWSPRPDQESWCDFWDRCKSCGKTTWHEHFKRYRDKPSNGLGLVDEDPLLP